MQQLVIYPKQVAQILGLGESAGRDHYNHIKDLLNKKQHQQVTITEFCEHEGLNRDEVMQVLFPKARVLNPQLSF